MLVPEHAPTVVVQVKTEPAAAEAAGQLPLVDDEPFTNNRTLPAGNAAFPLLLKLTVVPEAPSIFIC